MAHKNSWDRVESLDVGDASAQTIYLNVGIALSWFEVLQVRMTWLFQLIVEAPGSLALGRAFGTLESVPPRAAMIREAAKISFMNDPASRDKVVEFMTQFEALSHRRNEIAHGYVSQLTHNGQEKGNFLHPGSHMTKRNTTFLQVDRDPLGDYRYTAAQIGYYTQEFRRLGGEVQDFIDARRPKNVSGSHSP
jgi:hypothetical protein